MRAKFKPWAIPFMEEHPEYVKEELKIESNMPEYLEIGSGKGDFVISMASRFPNLFFHAVELCSSVAGISCKKMVESGLTNLDLIVGDVEDQMNLLHDECLDGIFLNFSDPWPKKRHEKRRLTYSAKLDSYYRILKPGAKIYFKTDKYEFYLFSLESFKKSKFKIIYNTEDYEFDESFDALTEYEKLFRSRGEKINRVILIKE